MRREVTQPRYWRRHVREAVRFADGLKTLANLKPDVCLEIGPHPTLLGFVQSNFAEQPTQPALVASLRKGRNDDEQLNDALGALYLAGVAVDWRAVWSATPHRWVDLPTYAFQREPCWFRAAACPAATARIRATRCSACACVRLCATSCSSSRCSAPTRCRTSPTTA